MCTFPTNGNVPETLTSTPSPPPISQQQLQRAQTRKKQRQTASSPTVLTSPLGTDTPPVLSQKTLLGQ